MKNKFTAILFFISIIASLNAQTDNFVWFNNINYNADSTNNQFIKNLKLLNNTDIKFFIVTGNVTANGYLDEFEDVKAFLDSTTLKYYLLPGENDLENSLSFGIDYKDTFGKDHFIFNDNSVLHIGISCQKYPFNNFAHITNGELNWVSNQLNSFPNIQKIFIYLNYPLSKIDNSLKLKNLLSEKDVRIFIADKNTSYNFVNIKDDSLTINDKFIDNTFYFIPQDSLDFIDYSLSGLSTRSKLKFTNIWQKDLKTYTPNEVLIAGDKYFIVSKNGTIYCLNNSGNINWTHKLTSEVLSKPELVNGLLVVATIQGDLLTINSKTGQTIQSIWIDDILTTKILRTKVNFYGEETNAVIVGSKKGRFYCYSLDKLEPIWSNNSSDSEIITKPLSINNRIIYGSKDGFVYSIDDRTGVLYWKWKPKRTKDTITDFSNPISDDGNIFISTSDGNIYKIDLLLGTTLLTISKGNPNLSLGLSSTGRTVIAFEEKENLLLYYSKTGGIYKKLRMDLGEEFTKHKPIEFDRNFLITTDKGTFFLVDKNYDIFPILFLGQSALHSVQQISDKEYLLSNYDGKIICFTLE